MGSQARWAGVVEDVRRAATPHGRQRLGQFAVEGPRLVERALRAGRPPKTVLVGESTSRNDKEVSNLILLLEEAGATIHRVPEGMMRELAEGRNSGVIFGLCEMPSDVTLRSLAQVAVLNHEPLLVLVDLEEPGNVGALIRTALASSARGVIAVGTTDPYHPKAVRTSMGSIFKIPIARSFELEPVLEQLSELRRIAAVTSGGSSPWDTKLDSRVALFVGRESEGLPAALVEQLDDRVSVPMPTTVDSFSVNAATAVLLYEATRQRSHPSPA